MESKGRRLSLKMIHVHSTTPGVMKMKQWPNTRLGIKAAWLLQLVVNPGVASVSYLYSCMCFELRGKDTAGECEVKKL